jgi:Sec-independent protein secretion pathway component TatC
MLLLFEGGLIAARFYSKKEQDDVPENEHADS